MFNNYLKIALRNILKYKAHSFINLLGLALSMSICLVIILFIREESSFDKFHENRDLIYRVNSKQRFESGMVDNLAASPAPLGPVLKDEYPGVENVVRLKNLQTTGVNKDKSFTINGIFAEPSFFNIFSFDLRAGDEQNVLVQPYAVALSEETAQKFFGDRDPVGKTLMLDKIGDATVTGVISRPVGKSHLKFDAVVSFATVEALNKPEFYLRDWQKSIGRYYTYILLDGETSTAYVQGAFPKIIETYYSEEEPGSVAFFLQALTDIRLGPELSNKIERQTPPVLLFLLFILALILTMAAAFNYMNLSVARSLKRAKEVGIRKVAGAFRRQIAIQFLGEAIVTAWIALAIALVMLEVWFIPAFNRLWLVRNYLEANIAFHFWSDPAAIFLFLAFATVVGLLAGIYPAIMFSSYLPSVVLKGTSNIKGFFGLTLRADHSSSCNLPCPFFSSFLRWLFFVRATICSQQTMVLTRSIFLI
jgi:putative ABC transport system permease protein